MGDAYDIKKVSESFKEALRKVVSQESVVEKAEADSMGIIDEGEKMATSNDGTKKAPQSEVNKQLKKLDPDMHKSTNEDVEEAVDLTEDQLCDILEEELGPHIAFLLDEGFSEDEIEDLIVDMLTTEEEDADETEETIQ